MKYLEGFKSYWFWLFVGVLYVANILAYHSQYEVRFMSEYMGYFIGSFISIALTYSICFGLYKIISVITRKIKK